jgi:hypothetical protein
MLKIAILLACLPYIENIKGGLWDHLAVSLSVSPLIFVRRLMRSPWCPCMRLLFSFSIQSVSYQRKLGDWFFPELPVYNLIISTSESVLSRTPSFVGLRLEPPPPLFFHWSVADQMLFFYKRGEKSWTLCDELQGLSSSFWFLYTRCPSPRPKRCNVREINLDSLVAILWMKPHPTYWSSN